MSIFIFSKIFVFGPTQYGVVWIDWSLSKSSSIRFFAKLLWSKLLPKLLEILVDCPQFHSETEIISIIAWHLFVNAASSVLRLRARRCDAISGFLNASLLYSAWRCAGLSIFSFNGVHGDTMFRWISVPYVFCQSKLTISEDINKFIKRPTGNDFQ